MKLSHKILISSALIFANSLFASTAFATLVVPVSASCNTLSHPPPTCPATVSAAGDDTNSYVSYFGTSLSGGTDGGGWGGQTDIVDSNGLTHYQWSCLGYGPFPDWTCSNTVTGPSRPVSISGVGAQIGIVSAEGYGDITGNAWYEFCNAGEYATSGACQPVTGTITAQLANPACTGTCDINVSWSTTYAGVVPFNDVYRDGSLWQHQHISVPSATDSAKPVGTYQYCVRGYDGYGNPTGDLDCASVTVPPASGPGPGFQPVSCDPQPSQTVAPNQPANFTVNGGNPATLAWSGGGSPATGSGNSFSTSYSSAGVYTITVTDGVTSDTCQATVLICSLSVNGSTISSTITAGGSATFINSSTPTGKTFRWRGTDNGVAISPSPGGSTDQTDVWSFATPAVYTRYAEVTSDGNVAACTTNTVTLNVIPPSGGWPGGFTLNPPGSPGPGNTYGYCSGSNSVISLAWDASTGATSYTVHRSGGAAFTPVNVGTSLTYDDASAVDSTAYTYYVTAANGFGTMDSNTISITAEDCSTPSAPTISLSPSSFSFSGISGGATPAGQTMAIQNTGTATLNWTGSNNFPGKPGTWCSVSPTSGSLAAGASQNVTISVTAPSAIGNWTNCGIRISDPLATNDPQDADITYTVSAVAAPTILLTPQSFTFNGIQGGTTPAGQTMNIKNVGTASLSWGAIAVPGKPAGWCHISTFFGTLAPGASQNVNIYVDAPTNPNTSPGWQDCGIGIAGQSGTTNTPQNVDITYTVSSSGIACSANADCGDANACTTDTCVNPGTVSSYCDNANNPVDGGWSAWSACVANVQTRTCTNPPLSCGGTTCVGPNSQACGGPANPGNPGGGNWATSGGAIGCAAVRISWTDISGEDGYYIYRDANSNLGDGYAQRYTAAADATYYDVTPGDTNNYYYYVSSYNVNGESAKVAISQTFVAATGCAGSMVSSDKDIVEINGNPVLKNGVPPSQCGGTDTFASSTQLQINNKLKFSINLCNSGNSAATSVSVVDTMTNLGQPVGGWNVKYDDGTGESSTLPGGMSYSVSGSAPNQTITFSGVPNVPAGGGLPTIRRITFEAVIKLPNGYNGSSSRFQNRISVNYDGGSIANSGTPYIPFSTGQSPPVIIEVP